MPKLIGISNTPPVYALGLCEVFSDSRFVFQIAEAPSPWIREHPDAGLLHGVHHEHDLEVVIELTRADPTRMVVTIVDDLDLTRLQSSLRAGAIAAVDVAATPEEISVVIDGAVLDKSVVPAELARSMTKSNPDMNNCPSLTKLEIGLLQGLASGVTVAELGRRSAYSDREIYRKLKTTYRKLGVNRRVDALLTASRWGLLD